MPLILGTNSIKDTGYDVDNSLRFNDGSSDYLSRTPGSTGNTKKFTVSFWLKRGTITGADQNIFHAYPGSGSRSQILFNSSEQLLVDLEAGNTNRLITTRVFRDTSAWYHIVIVYDSDNGTSGDRVIIYINGVRETSFGTETYPSSGSTSQINTTTQHEISSYDGSGSYFDGYLAEFVLLDGTVADATSFGEFDSDSPTIWKPKDVSGLTFGTNGFYLDFEDSSALGNDAAGSNNFTVNNLTAADQSIDTCTNNWSNLNAIDNINSVLSEGNLRTTGTSNWSKVNSTFSMPNGSWYVEIYSKVGSGNGNSGIGIKRVESPTAATLLGYESTSYGYLSNGNIYNNNGVITGSLATWSAGDIMSMSFTGSVLKFYKNNSLIHTISSLTGEYMFSFGSYPSDSYIVNFGQDGTFSGEVTAQGNSDPNGYGNFYYSPGSFYALNTKNLAEFG